MMTLWNEGGSEGIDRRGATRRALLRAAQQLFVGRGYRETAVSDIVRDAGVSQGTFYLYFPNKPGIVLALMDIGSRRLQDLAGQHLEAQPSPAQAIAAFIVEMTAFFRANKSFLLVLFREVEEQQVSEARQRHNAALCEILRPAIARGVHAGELRDDDPAVLAAMVVETAFALVYRFTLGPDEAVPEDIEHRIATFCVAALAAR